MYMLCCYLGNFLGCVVFLCYLCAVPVQVIDWKDSSNVLMGTLKPTKNFAPPQPPSLGRGTANQLETVTTFTYKPSLVRIDARNFELSW